METLYLKEYSQEYFNFLLKEGEQLVPVRLNCTSIPTLTPLGGGRYLSLIPLYKYVRQSQKVIWHSEGLGEAPLFVGSSLFCFPKEEGDYLVWSNELGTPYPATNEIWVTREIPWVPTQEDSISFSVLLPLYDEKEEEKGGYETKFVCVNKQVRPERVVQFLLSHFSSNYDSKEFEEKCANFEGGYGKLVQIKDEKQRKSVVITLEGLHLLYPNLK